MVGIDCSRWGIGTTFQECRGCLGLETTGGQCRATAARAAPCRFALYTVAAVPFHPLPEAERVASVNWVGKVTIPRSDALTAVRRRVRADGGFPQARADGAAAELPPHVRELLPSALAPAP